MKAAPTVDILRNEARRLAALRLELLDAHPFWGHLLLQVQLVPALSLPTLAATDCRNHIWYNPKFTHHLDFRQLGFVLAHEIGHHVFESLSRRDGRNLHLWNCATDYAINRMVAAMESDRGRLYQAPSGRVPGLGDVQPLLDKRFDGMTAEQIYDKLWEESPPLEPTTITLELPRGPGVGKVSDHHGGIDVHLPNRLSAADRGALVDRLSSAVEAHRASGANVDLPPGVERLVDGLLPPSVPWQRLLARYVGEAQAQQDYSYARPNRRWLMEDLLVPGLHSEDPGRVVVAVDTSGSIGPKLLQAMASELGRLSTLVPQITVLIADAQVHTEVPTQDLAGFLQRQTFKGGGGTNHVPVFEWIAKRNLRPELFIGLTDLRSHFPAVKPPFPVVWVVPKRHGRAPWGRVCEAELPS